VTQASSGPSREVAHRLQSAEGRFPRLPRGRLFDSRSSKALATRYALSSFTSRCAGPVDTKLARIQGRSPDAMHVVTGGRRTRVLPPRFLHGLLPAAAEGFLDTVATRADSYPYPVEHCGICDFLSLCQKQ
jgi:hypothetical protein